MKFLKRLTMVSFALVLFSCGSSYDLTKETSLPELSETTLNNFMVLVLYPDNEIETRVALEKSTTDHLKSKGLNATAGFTKIPSYSNLEGKVSEVHAAMENTQSENLLIITPVKYKNYSDTDNYDAAMSYRALGLETAEFITNVSALIEQSEASNFVMEVALWDRSSENFLWEGVYNIKAPDGYDLDYAKLYSKEFIDKILADIKNSKNKS